MHEEDTLINYEIFLSMLYRNFTSFNTRGILKDLIFVKDDDLRLQFTFWKYNRKQISHQALKQEIELISWRLAKHKCDKIFINCTFDVGRKLSNKERNDNGSNNSLNYGEIDYESFYQTLSTLKRLETSDKNNYITQNKVFYDLGCGTGKALVAVRLTEDFKKVHGVEIMSSLYQEGKKRIDIFNSKLNDKGLLLTYNEPITIQQGDILEVDWSDGDIVFCNSTAFCPDLMEKLSKKASQLKIDSIVITYTKALSDDCFKIIDKSRIKASWGACSALIHKKIK